MLSLLVPQKDQSTLTPTNDLAKSASMCSGQEFGRKSLPAPLNSSFPLPSDPSQADQPTFTRPLSPYSGTPQGFSSQGTGSHSIASTSQFNRSQSSHPPFLPQPSRLPLPQTSHSGLPRSRNRQSIPQIPIHSHSYSDTYASPQSSLKSPLQLSGRSSGSQSRNPHPLHYDKTRSGQVFQEKLLPSGGVLLLENEEPFPIYAGQGLQLSSGKALPTEQNHSQPIQEESPSPPPPPAVYSSSQWARGQSASVRCVTHSDDPFLVDEATTSNWPLGTDYFSDELSQGWTDEDSDYITSHSLENSRSQWLGSTPSRVHSRDASFSGLPPEPRRRVVSSSPYPASSRSDTVSPLPPMSSNIPPPPIPHTTKVEVGGASIEQL